MQKTLWPEIVQPSSVLVAMVAGFVRSWAGSLIAAAKTSPSWTICASELPKAASRRSSFRGARFLPAAEEVDDVGEVHVDADRERGVAAREPARGNDEVVDRGDAEAAQVLRHGCPEVAALLDEGEALEREAARAVVCGGRRADLLCEGLGERDEAPARFGARCQLEGHDGRLTRGGCAWAAGR